MNNKKELIYEINKNFILNNREINIIEYAEFLNNRFYNIDISFMAYFLELIEKDKCCIHYKKLEEYEIYYFKDSYNFKKILEKNNFIENVDFEALFEEGLHDGYNKIVYFLHPKCFKKLLIRSLKNQKYADYYLFLEEIIKYYNEYQLSLIKNKLMDVNEKLNSTNNNIVDNKEAIYNFEGINANDIPRIYLIKLDEETVTISRSSLYCYIIKRMIKLKKEFPNLNFDNDLKYIDIVGNLDIYRRYIKVALSNYKTPIPSRYKINFDVCYELVKKVINDKIIDNVDNLIIS